MVRPVLEKKFYVRKISLFGSCARDQATKSSDIDLAVQFSEASSFGLIGRLTVFLETLLDGRKVDLVERNRLTPEVLKAALREF